MNVVVRANCPGFAAEHRPIPLTDFLWVVTDTNAGEKIAERS